MVKQCPLPDVHEHLVGVGSKPKEGIIAKKMLSQQYHWHLLDTVRSVKASEKSVLSDRELYICCLQGQISGVVTSKDYVVEEFETPH